jgi:hypothetical protein
VIEAAILRCCNGEVLQADLLDISRVSVRLALHPGVRLELGESCLIRWRPASGEEVALEGAVIRIEAHGMITVVVILFQDGDSDSLP